MILEQLYAERVSVMLFNIHGNRRNKDKEYAIHDVLVGARGLPVDRDLVQGHQGLLFRREPVTRKDQVSSTRNYNQYGFSHSIDHLLVKDGVPLVLDVIALLIYVLAVDNTSALLFLLELAGAGSLLGTHKQERNDINISMTQSNDVLT